MAGRWRDVCGVRIAPAELRFSDTAPGSTYRASLTVQNLQASSCRLRLLPPSRPQFKLIVENPAKPIASGLQLKAVVEYSPACAEDLRDKLVLLVDDDRVDIPLLGLIPQCQLEIESEINFGDMITNNKIITKKIRITNHGSISGIFRVSYDGLVLLNINPKRGVVKPKSVRTIEVGICTDVPGVIKEMMKVDLEGRGYIEVWIKGVVVEQTLKVLGVSCGKLLKCINFGPLYFGTSKTEQINLYNESPECMDWIAVVEDNAIGGEMGTDLRGSTDAVLQDLSLKNKNIDASTLILCIPSQGTLMPFEKSLITVCFSPEKFERDFEVADSLLIQDYVVFLRFETVGKRGDCLQTLSDGATATTRSNSRHVDLALMGSGFPVMITFKPGPVINFKECYFGEKTQVLCTIKNESEFLPVTFSFRKTAHFNVSPERGHLKKKTEKELVISFSPHQIGTFEMKQIVDIIGTGIDKNSGSILKTKSFHQIYLTFLGVCKSKRKNILFSINPGLTPLISNPAGQFVVHDTGQFSGTAPVAILKSTQTQIHAHRKNRNCKDNALVAFPNDRAASLRPGEWNVMYRTIFTKTERYNYIDPEFAYTDSELVLRKENKKYYIDFVSRLRQRRLEKEAAREFILYNNPVSIGIKPAGGLVSPYISITNILKEKPQKKMLALEDNCLLTSRKLAAIVSKSTNKGVWSWLSPMPSSTQEKEDCKLTLTHKQLHQIFIGPSTIDFGEVSVYSTTTKELHIINNLSVHIWIQVEIEFVELQETSPLSQVVPPLTKTHIPIVFETNTIGMFKRSFSYKINNQHVGYVLVVAHVLPIELGLSKRELILTPIPGYLAGAEFRRAVRVCNRRNHPAGFTWKSVNDYGKNAFFIKPVRGFVEAYSDLECEVVWRPGFSASETGEFTLCARRGKSVTLKCIAKLGTTRVQLMTPSVSLTQCPIGLTVSKTATILNTGPNHAYFQVRDPNPLPGMKIIPSEGVIPVGGLTELKISFTPKGRMTFDKKVQVAVRNAGELVLNIDGFAGIADINVDVGLFEYESVYVGSTKSIPFLLENRGDLHARVEFDFTLYKDFKLDAGDNSVAIECPSSKRYLHSIDLKEKSSLKCFLTFRPTQVAVYDFFLPIGVPGVNPPSAPPVPPRHGLVPQPATKSLPACRVKGIALQSLLELSSTHLKFEQHSSNMHSDTADGSMNSQSFVLKNVSKYDLKWKLNLDDAEKNIEDGIFRCSTKSGHLAVGEEVSIDVFFCPPCPGTYTSKISLSLKRNPSRYQVRLTGTLKSPKLKFHPPFLMLMPVPLDVETEAVFTIIPQDYIRKSRIQVKLPEFELGDGIRTNLFTVEFPGGQDIALLSDGTIIELICRVKFRSPKPISYLAEMLFIDEEENRFSFQIAATADNCLLTLYPYLALHYPQQKIVWRTNNKDFSTGEVVLQPCVMPQSPSHSVSISSSSFGTTPGSTSEYSLYSESTFESDSDEYESEESEEINEESKFESGSDESGSKRLVSYFPDDDTEEYIFFQKTLAAVKSWFTLFGWPRGQNPISVPQSMRRDVCIVQLTVAQEKVFKRKFDRGKGFYEMLIHLNGQPIPGISASQSLPLDPVERMFQLHWQHSELLSFLKSQGASLSHVMPEFLLTHEDYKIWTEVHTGMRCFIPEVRRGSMRSSGKLSGRRFFALADRTFETMSKRAWTDVLLQIYKVFVLPRVSFHIVPDPASLESLHNMPGIKSEPLSSNVYSRYERTILIWLNKNYEKNRKIVWKDSPKGGIPPMRWIVNFDQDLLDGLVLAAQVAAYCPYLIPIRFIKMHTNPRTQEQFLHNCLILVKALRTLNLNMGIRAVDICDPNPIRMLMLCVHLYENLPQYLPTSTIEFTGALHATVVKQVRLKNPGRNTLMYNAVLVGRDARAFSLLKGHTVTIPAMKQGFVTVEFTFRFLRPAEAVLILTSNRVDGIEGATLTFSLKSELKHIDPIGILRCRCPCYEMKKFNLNVTNPFKTDGMFRVILLESTHYLLSPEKIYLAKQVKLEKKFSSENNVLDSKISALPEDSNKDICPDQSGLLHEFFTPMEQLFLKAKSSAALQIQFLPFHQERRYCAIILVNERIGEFLYVIEGVGDLPLPSELPALDSPNVLCATNTDASAVHSVLYLKCGLGQTLEENLRIPLVNEARERALALAAQQQMSALEYERRLMTGTLLSSSVRVATALLGLSRVERRALLTPRKQPPELKYVDYTVEMSMKEFFEAPKKFSIPVLASTRVNLDAPSAKYPTTRKTGGSDTVELPIKFTPQNAGVYHCQIRLKSSSDVRVYEIQCVVNADQADAQIEFVTPAYQTVTQEIPITNMSSQDWRFEAHLEGQCFYGPSAIDVPVGGTVPYPLTFKPIAECIITGKLILRNVTAGTQNMFGLKGIGKKPLPQDYIVVECEVGKVAHKILWVHNYTKKVLTYKVFSNLSMLSGAPVLTVNPEDTAAYTLSISPCRRGIFQGVISFVAQDEEAQQSPGSSSPQKADGKRVLQKRRAVTPRALEAPNLGESSTNCTVWFSLKICSTPAAAERTIQVECRALDIVGINIPIINPTNENLRMSVLLDHPSLSGEKSFIIKPKQTFSYNLQFSPAALGHFKGSVMFRSDLMGEFWYALKFNVGKPSPTGLPDVKCELGRSAYTYIALVNPTNETLQLQMVNNDPSHFSVDTDPEQPLTLPPCSTTDLPVRFCPSALGRCNHKATIIFKCPKFAERVFHLTGSGLPPKLMETTTISACIGEYASAIVSFQNPTLETVVVDVMLTDPGLLDQHLSASELYKSTSKESTFHLLVKQPRGIRLEPKEKLDIPVLFMPDEMKTYKTAVVIHVMRENGENWPYKITGGSNKDLNRNVTVTENGETHGILWIYPIYGMSEAPQPESVVIRCQAKQRLEKKVEMMLIGVSSAATALPDAGNSATANTEESSSTQEVTDGSSETLEFLYELQCQSDEIKTQLESWLGMQLLEKEWDTESRIVTLVFNVVFAPSKPIRSEAMLAVQCTTGGLWKFPLLFIATEPEVDDVINIEAVGLNKESIVGLKLTSQTSSPEPFTAHFLAGSDPDFLVMPQAGELLPAGTVGTPITVGYKPRMYGRKHTATLVIETQSMRWTYEINGLPPPFVPPTMAAKVVCTSSYTGSSTVRQRKFLRENLNLTTTGASSPIKGAPLVLRKKQRK